MKKTILFLGAGMSATFGYPVTKDILPAIVNKLKRGTLFNDCSICSLYAFDHEAPPGGPQSIYKS